MFKVSLILLGFVGAVLAQEDLKIILRVFQDCTGPGVETSPCLKMKLVSAIDRASAARDLEIFSGFHLVKDNQDIDNEVSEPELAASLPRASEDQETALDNIIVAKVTNFIKTRSVQFKLKNLSEIPRSLGFEEGRKRRKGMGSLFMMLFMMAGTMIPLKIGTLALLAGKALIVSKLALALAAIVGLKKLVGGGEDYHQVVQVPHGHHKRSIDLPYRAYAPAN